MPKGYTKRDRGSSFEYVFKKAGVLDKPLYLNFKDEREGDNYAARLVALLDRGIVPTEHQVSKTVTIITDLVLAYLREAHPSDKDREVLNVVMKTKGSTNLQHIDAAWVDSWIIEMKRIEQRKPATIRARVGALARCCDWGMRKKLLMMPDHPLRTLPDGYAQYTELDLQIIGATQEEMKDEERDRRLHDGEREKIFAVIDHGVLPRKQRPFTIPWPYVLKVMFDLALESAMRLREMYTLTIDQVDLRQRTIFLDKTKNGSKRQVPMSSVAITLLTDYLAWRTGIAEQLTKSQLFPVWNGSYDKRYLKNLSNELSKLYDSIIEVAECDDLQFHDLRHEATSRLFERTTLSESEIMKITGHKTHKMMMRYANLRGSTLAAKLW